MDLKTTKTTARENENFRLFKHRRKTRTTRLKSLISKLNQNLSIRSV